MTEDQQLRLRNFLIGLMRTVGAIVVALAFISVLMASSAQQNALRQLGAIDPSLDYNSASNTALDVARRERAADEAIRSQASFRHAADAANVEAIDAAAGFDRAWQPLGAALPDLTTKDRCAGAAPTGNELGIDARWRLVQILKLCSQTGRLNAQQMRSLNEALKAKGGLEDSYAAAVGARTKAAVAAQRLQQAQADVKELTSTSTDDEKKNDKIKNAFDGTTKVRESWYLGGSWLIDFSPSLLQILLSFVSGAFGALLLTLVLIVYPNTGFTVASAGGYGPRTLLGGLIALCVFVMLSSGSAVLGASGSAPASNNYMAYCAIGILAGMFSDRVAAWLSERSTVFFSGDGEDEDAKAKPVAPPAAPAAGKV